MSGDYPLPHIDFRTWAVRPLRES